MPRARFRATASGRPTPSSSYDLAIDASGQGVPSWVRAGFDAPAPIIVESATWTRLLVAVVVAVGLLVLVVSFPRPSAGRMMTPLG